MPLTATTFPERKKSVTKSQTVARPANKSYDTSTKQGDHAEVSDTSILGRIAAGDESAVQHCIDQYGGLVWSLARRMTPNKEEAEDAVQEIFIDLWKSSARFDARQASEKTFIAMVARRRLIDRLRQADRRPQIQQLEESGDFGDNQHSWMEKTVDAGIAGEIMRELKPDQQKVLELSIRWGMSHGEIAMVTSMAIGTVKSHIRRGMALIRQRMTEPSLAGGRK
jgi:RNA polymerase sigma-70 factor (ECF subfamily)